MIDKEKLNQVNNELVKIKIHHALFKQAVDELGLSVGDVIEVTGSLLLPERGYFKSIKVYYDQWVDRIRAEIYMNKIKKDGTEGKIGISESGPFREIRIINHNSEE